MMRRFIRVFFGGLLSLVLTVPPASAEPSAQLTYPKSSPGAPIIRNYLPEEYGAMAANWRAIQDGQGIMYFGNEGGVLIFDGVNWELLRVDNKIRVRSFAVDQRNTVYVGGADEFGYLAVDRRGRRVYRSISKLLKKEARKFHDVWSTHATSHGVYFFTVDKIFRWHRDQLSTIRSPGGNAGFLVDDDVYIVHRTGGMSCLRNGRLHRLPSTTQISGETAGRTVLLPYEKNQLLVVTTKMGSFLYPRFPSDAPQPPLSAGLVRFHTEVDDYLRHNSLYTNCAHLGTEAYFFPTLNGGVVAMDKRGKLLRIINGNRGLAKGPVSAVYLDRHHNLWVTTTIGISHVTRSSPWSIFDTANEAKSKILFATRHKGVTYISTFNGVFYLPPYRLQLNDDHQRFVPLEGADSLQSFVLYTKEDLMLAGVDAKVYQVLGGKARLLVELKEQQRLSAIGRSTRFPQIYFLGSYASGLKAMRIAPANDTDSNDENKELSPEMVGEIIPFDAPAVDKRTILQILSDDAGDLWISTDANGLYHLQFVDNDLRRNSIVRIGAAHGLPEHDTHFIQWYDNQLLVSNPDGIFRLVPDEKSPPTIRFVRDFQLNQLFDGPKSGGVMLSVHGRDLLVYSSNDLGWLRQEKNNSYRWDKTPFRIFESGYTGGVRPYVDNDGVVWILKDSVVYRFDPAVDKNYALDYLTRVVEVEAAGGESIFYGHYLKTPIRAEADHSIEMSRTQPAWARPSLSYHRNSLTFRFAAAYYEYANRVRYSHRLSGFDTGWSSWSESTQKEYTNLPEGDYCFRVKAQNVFDWESSPAVYCFTILPPWYRTLWAYISYLLLGFLCFVGGIRLYTWRLIVSRKKLQQIVKKRTTEVVAQKEEIEAQAEQLIATNLALERKTDEVTRQKDEIKLTHDALWGEMQLAKKIQTVLLPEIPHIKGYDIAAYMKPAEEVGGDYYDVINVGDTNWLVIGDVSGHGVSAGLIMMMVQTSLRSVLDHLNNAPPAQVLATVNRIIYDNIRRLGENKYMTITIISVQRDGSLYYSGLHQDILIYRAEDGEVERLETNGMWIGVLDEIEDTLNVEWCHLDPGDTMLLYTDGITEAADANGEMFSDEELVSVFQKNGHLPVTEIEDAVLYALDGYTCDDDITLMVIKRCESR